MADFFKVVYIKELKEVEPVPHLWEVKGILYWPPTKKELRQNQSNVKSIPNISSWIQYTCEVKQSNILLYHHASSAADRICEDSSTEEEREELHYQSKKRRTSNILSKYDHNDYESYFHYENPSSSRQVNIAKSEINLNDCSSNSVDSQNETILAPNPSATVYDMVPNGQISAEFEKLYAFLNKFEQNIDNKFAEMAIKLDHIDKRLRECEVAPEKDQDANMLFPMNAVDDVREFEEKLNIAEYKTKIFGHLRRVNGTGLFWKSACYKLCGFLFTKTLLTRYSWTGLSRTNAAKESFNKLGNILDLFYRVVQYSDSSFNYAHRDSFFRDGVLKHSITRLHGPKKKPLVLEAGKENIVIGDEEEQGHVQENTESD